MEPQGLSGLDSLGVAPTAPPRGNALVQEFLGLVRAFQELRGSPGGQLVDQGWEILHDTLAMALETSVAVSTYSRRSARLDPFGLDPDYADRFRPLFEFLFNRYWRVEVHGLEHIPASGRALLVANHSGTLPYDATMIMIAVRVHHPSHRLPRPLVEDFIYHMPFLGTFINRVGGVRACRENGERLLEHDQLTIAFPEGIKGMGKTFGERYQLQRFGRGGFVKLAQTTGSPIIPTAVIGAEEIHPILFKITWLARHLAFPYFPVTPTFPALGPLGLLPLPSKWIIRFGEPIEADPRGPEFNDDPIAVQRRGEDIRSQIQEMVNHLLETRPSMFLG